MTLNILWIEDQIYWAKQYVGVLENEGHRVDFAETANDALDKLEEDHSYDVVILDVWLPPGVRRNGVSRPVIDSANQLEMGVVILRYARDKMISMPPVVILSGVLTEERKDALGEFTNWILAKPPSLEDFLTMVKGAGGVSQNGTS